MARRASIRAFTLWDIMPTEEADSTPRSLRASKMARCAQLLARNSHSPRRRAHIKRYLNPEPQAKLFSSAEKERGRVGAGNFERIIRFARFKKNPIRVRGGSYDGDKNENQRQSKA